jgi:F0F1-type ATP synthase membrane subunit b/b'
MAFTAAQLSLPDSIEIIDGVIHQGQRLRAIETQQRIDRLLDQARREASALLAQARRDAAAIVSEARQQRDQTQVQTQQQAHSLLQQIDREWRRVVEALEPTAVAVARLAIEHVCAGSTLAERVDAAARVAVRELPENPVRLCVPTGAGDLIAESTLDEGVPVQEDPALSPGCVRLEGEHGACEVDFDVAKTAVTNCLANWSERAVALMQNHSPPSTAPGEPQG